MDVAVLYVELLPCGAVRARIADVLDQLGERAAGGRRASAALPRPPTPGFAARRQPSSTAMTFPANGTERAVLSALGTEAGLEGAPPVAELVKVWVRGTEGHEAERRRRGSSAWVAFVQLYRANHGDRHRPGRALGCTVATWSRRSPSRRRSDESSSRSRRCHCAHFVSLCRQLSHLRSAIRECTHVHARRRRHPAAYRRRRSAGASSPSPSLSSRDPRRRRPSVLWLPTVRATTCAASSAPHANLFVQPPHLDRWRDEANPTGHVFYPPRDRGLGRQSWRREHSTARAINQTGLDTSNQFDVSSGVVASSVEALSFLRVIGDRHRWAILSSAGGQRSAGRRAHAAGR